MKLVHLCVYLECTVNVRFYDLLKNSRFCVMFTGPINTFSAKKFLKLRLTILFIYLKIILLQYFQFLIISSIQTDPKNLTTLRFLAQKTKTTKRSDELHFYRERQDKYNFWEIVHLKLEGLIAFETSGRVAHLKLERPIALNFRN